jgi:hypothetical protein
MQSDLRIKPPPEVIQPSITAAGPVRDTGQVAVKFYADARAVNQLAAKLATRVCLNLIKHKLNVFAFRDGQIEPG